MVCDRHRHGPLNGPLMAPRVSRKADTPQG